MTGKLILPGAVEAALTKQEAVTAAKPDLTDPLVNPHKLTADDLKEYQPHHQPLVLKYGRKKFGMACSVLAANGAMNHLGDLGRRFGCMRGMQQPMEALQGIFANLFQEISITNGWTPAEIKAVQGEITRAEVLQGTPALLGPTGAPLH